MFFSIKILYHIIILRTYNISFYLINQIQYFKFSYILHKKQYYIKIFKINYIFFSFF